MKRSSEDYSSHLPTKVALVERNSVPCALALVGKQSRNDLVELAMEIQKADNFIHANACNKLQMIAQQVRFLQQQAETVLRETKMNLNLHHAACNFVKVPGNIYHLYRRPQKEQSYFSMLSPQEWINCPHEYLGSFRLEQDHSWTPVEQIDNKDVQLSLINKILTGSDGKLCITFENTAMEM